MIAVRPFAVVFLCLIPLAGWTQWQWIDNDGRKVFSDQAPPASIPQKFILHRPDLALAAPADALSADPARSAASATSPARVDPELERKARKTDEVANVARAVEAQNIVKAKADNCDRARRGKASFDSGLRMRRMNPQGESEIMSDEARAAEQSHLQSVIASDCT